MNTTTITDERQLLERAAKAGRLYYLLDIPGSDQLRGGLLCHGRDGRTQPGNRLIEYAALFQLVVAAPTISLQDVLREASRIGGSDAARRAYMRGDFVRAVCHQ